MRIQQTFAPRRARKQEFEKRLNHAQIQRLDHWIVSNQYTYAQISELTRQHFPYHVKHSAIGVRANKIREAQYLSRVSRLAINTETYLKLVRNEPAQLEGAALRALLAAAAAIINYPGETHTPSTLLTLQRIFNHPFQTQMQRSFEALTAQRFKNRENELRYREERRAWKLNQPAK